MNPRVIGQLAPMVQGEAELGSGRVVRVGARQTLLDLADGRRVSARLALAFTYVPQEGDELLVIGQEERFFVIGVLYGQGETTLELPGDVTMRAEGDLSLTAGGGIELAAPEVDVQTGQMRMVAERIVESAHELYRRVRDHWSVRAGSKTEQVAGEWSVRAEKASLATEEDVAINGREIRLG